MTKLLINEDVTIENIINLNKRGFEFIIEDGKVTYAFA